MLSHFPMIPMTFRKTILTYCLSVAGFVASGLSAVDANAQEPSKASAIATLRDWRQRLLLADEKSVKTQKDIVTNLSKASAQSDIEAPLSDIAKIDDERVEIEAQRRIVDQLTFAVDTKWSGAELKAFLETQLLDLAITDLSEPGQGGWWKFLIKSSIALREQAEPGADPIRFLEGYMAESTVLEPKPVLDVVKSRTYIGR